MREAQTRNLEIPGLVLWTSPERQSLACSPSTVDGVGGTRDIAGLVGGEERHDRGNLRSLAEPARRNPLDDLFIGRRCVAGVATLDDRAQHPAVDQAGADAIYPHAGRCAFQRGALGE